MLKTTLPSSQLFSVHFIDIGPTYEVDGTPCIVTSHFVGDKDINDVIMKYAENRAMSEMLGLVPSAVTA